MQIDLLQKLLNEQEKLNYKITNNWINIHNLSSKELNEWLLNFSRALIHEAIELEDSCNWKWWKKQELDMNTIKIEAIDCLHFLSSIFLALDMNAKDIYDLYMKKNQLNIERQDKGYKTGEYQKVIDGKEDNWYLLEKER